jgi:hypothetical protein
VHRAVSSPCVAQSSHSSARVFGLGVLGFAVLNTVNCFAVLDSVFGFAVLDTVTGFAVLDTVNWFGVFYGVQAFAGVTQYLELMV